MLSEKPPVSSARTEVKPAEKMILGLLLDNPALISRVAEDIALDDFYHPVIKKILQNMMADKAAGWSARQLMNLYGEDPEVVQMISMACSAVDELLDRNKALEDCLSQMKLSRLRTERAGLIAQILTAERAGDQNRINKFMSDMDELNQKEKRLNEKK